MENDIILAVRQNPRILRDVTRLPELNTHRPSIIEMMAIENIERQAFGRRRWANRNKSRHDYYSRFLKDEEKKALTFEANMMKNSWLRGVDLYQ